MGPGEISARVGRNVRAYRVRQGMTQERLAELLTDGGMPLSDAAVSRLESGQRAITVDHLVALAEILDSSPVELLEPMPATSPEWYDDSHDETDQRWYVPGRDEPMTDEAAAMLAGLVSEETLATLRKITAMASRQTAESLADRVRPMMERLARLEDGGTTRGQR